MGEKILLFRRAFFALLFGSCLQLICAAAAGVETAATLTIENRQIAVLRARVLGRPAEERVQGAKSRIERALENGSAGVVTTRGHVHWVVTEHGAVNLHGLTLRERAEALISVAAPEFRAELRRVVNETKHFSLG